MAISGFRHIGLKIVSIALAALLWILVSGEQIVERAQRIPLEFTNVPANLEMVDEPPTMVDVRVRGSSGALTRVGAGELVALLDLALAREGQRLFHLTTADVRAPFGVEVVQISPSNISIRFEPLTTKVVPIVPSIEGEPEIGYVIGTVKADPATVEIVGAASRLAGVTEAITEPVTVNRAAAPFIETVAVGAPDPSVRLRQPQVARVSVVITAAPVEWRVDAVPVQIRNAARTTSVTPKQVTVFARGPQQSAGTAPSDFDAYVDVEGLGPGEFNVVVRVVHPPGVGVVRTEPGQVRVGIR